MNKLPPHDIAAEEGVIGSLLMDGQLINTVHLKPADFYHQPARDVYAVCLSLKNRRESINQITVAQEIERQGLECGGVAYLSHVISQVPTSLEIDSYAAIVERLAVSRNIIKLGQQMQEVGYKANGHSMESVTQLMQQFRKSNTTFKNLVSPNQAADMMLGLISEYGEPDHAIRWGYFALDEITSGIYPSELTIIGARPSVGKTQLMLDVAENVQLQGKNILFCSVEMSVKHLLERKISRETGIKIRELRRQGVPETLDGRVAELAAKISESNIYYLAQGTGTDDIYQQAYKLKEEVGLDIVFVDYLQKLSDCWKDSKENQNVRTGRASKRLKELADDLDVPVICASQLSRNLEFRSQDHRCPTLADLRDSGNIEQDADVVFLLHRDPDHKNILEVNMAKNRQMGSSPPVQLGWHNELNRYVDLVK